LRFSCAKLIILLFLLKASICSWSTFAACAPAFLAAGCRRAVVAGGQWIDAKGNSY
jgi:hypothetical protein